MGPGYSSIVADGGRIITMARSGEDEVVVALNARNGATEWEHKYRTTSSSEPPNSTPTIAGDRVYTLGVAGMLSALDKSSGKLVWSHDLVKEYSAKAPEYGFATSPIVHGESLILPVGGKNFGVAAFALADGELIWHKHDFEEAYASPILIEVDGEAQIAVLVAEQVVGLNPQTGELLWSEPIKGGQNIASPIWSADNLLCVTASMEGSVGLRFSKIDGVTKVERLWTNDKLQIAQTTVVRVGDHFYGSTGYDPYFVTAFSAKTGEVVWREPGFSLSNLVSADGKLLVLDVEGALGLATLGADGWRVNSKVNLLAAQAFTAPTLVDNCLYLRDLQKIVAVALGKPNE